MEDTSQFRPHHEGGGTLGPFMMDLSYLLKLDIQFNDAPAAAKIKPEIFQQRLTALGFKKRDDMKPEHPLANSLWVDELRYHEILCPDHDRYSDYGRRAVELVRDLAALYRKKELEMFHELYTEQQKLHPAK